MIFSLITRKARDKSTMLRSRIGEHARLVGNLKFENTLLICGEFSGRINGGKVLIVDKGARVDAKIEVDTLIARGHVQGNITARASVILEEDSVVHADIKTKDIHIATHAQYEGHCVTVL